MQPVSFAIDPDIRRAETLPASVYRDAAWYERVRERVLAPAWHVVGEVAGLEAPGACRPATLAPGSLDEPLVLVRGDDGMLRCLSNACTHRGALLVDAACVQRALRCRYHGRRFGLDGRFQSMPEFEQAADFPRPADDLPEVALASLGPLLFASLAPQAPLDALLAPLRERLAFVPWDELRADPGAARDYELAANWALYVDNYLEGFHLPFVHPELSRSIDYAAYRTELSPGLSLQLGVAQPGEPCFDLPAAHPDGGQRVGAYYYWLFPTTMLNLYPWGLSLNVVEPLGPARTRVRFRSYVWREELRGQGPGGELDLVERQDEAVVESVQRAVAGRLYARGRYSPAREQGVHHFHRLLASALQESP